MMLRRDVNSNAADRLGAEAPVLSRRTLLTVGLGVAGSVLFAGCSRGAGSTTSDADGAAEAGTSAGSDDASEPGGSAASTVAPASIGAAAVVYFSHPETTETVGLTEDEENSVVVVGGQAFGNTQYVAQLIAGAVGADLIRLEPAAPYPTDHDEIVDIAREEQRADARPELASLPDLAAYDTVFFGYPIWWSDMPQICHTFLENADVTGKTIIPFNTHGGSGAAGTVAHIAEAASGARVIEDNLVISRNDVDGCADTVTTWLGGLSL